MSFYQNIKLMKLGSVWQHSLRCPTSKTPPASPVEPVKSIRIFLHPVRSRKNLLLPDPNLLYSSPLFSGLKHSFPMAVSPKMVSQNFNIQNRRWLLQNQLNTGGGNPRVYAKISPAKRMLVSKEPKRTSSPSSKVQRN